MHCLREMIRGKEARRGGKCRQSLRVNRLETKLKRAFGTSRLDGVVKNNVGFFCDFHCVPEMHSTYLHLRRVRKTQTDWTHRETACAYIPLQHDVYVPKWEKESASAAVASRGKKKEDIFTAGLLALRGADNSIEATFPHGGAAPRDPFIHARRFHLSRLTGARGTGQSF